MSDLAYVMARIRLTLNWGYPDRTALLVTRVQITPAQGLRKHDTKAKAWRYQSGRSMYIAGRFRTLQEATGHCRSFRELHMVHDS